MFGRNEPGPVAGNGLRPYVATWELGLYQTLTRQSIVYRLEDKARGPQVFTFRLRLADPADLNKALSLSEQLALTMSVSSVRVARHLGLVDVEVALPRSFHRPLPVRALQRKGKTWVALGQTATGTPVHVNLSGNRTCQALVSGMTGSGKTLTQQLIAWTLATDNDPRAVNLLLIDAAMKNAQAGGKALRCDRRWAKGVNEAEACEITSSGSTSSQLDKQG